MCTKNVLLTCLSDGSNYDTSPGNFTTCPNACVTPTADEPGQPHCE